MGETDGRRRRRADNRQSVVDALVELFGEGRYQPSTLEIAERAGISPRSLFRYFEDLDDLIRAAIEHSLAEAQPLLDPGIDPAAPTGQKVERIVAARLRLYEAIGPAARAGRACAHRHRAVAQQIHDDRAYLRQQLRRLFAAELTGARAGRFGALDALCAFESYDLLRRDQAMSLRRTGDALTSAIAALLDVHEEMTQP